MTQAVRESTDVQRNFGQPMQAKQATPGLRHTHRRWPAAASAAADGLACIDEVAQGLVVGKPEACSVRVLPPQLASKRIELALQSCDPGCEVCCSLKGKHGRGCAPAADSGANPFRAKCRHVPDKTYCCQHGVQASCLVFKHRSMQASVLTAVIRQHIARQAEHIAKQAWQGQSTCTRGSGADPSRTNCPPRSRVRQAACLMRWMPFW